MGANLSQPVKLKESASGSGATHLWGSSCQQGWRASMEDSHITLSDLGGEDTGLSLFCVFDGHGGREVALFCRNHMPDVVRSQLRRMREFHGCDISGNLVGKDLGEALKRSFHAVDDLLRLPENQHELLMLREESLGRGLSSQLSTSSSSSVYQSGGDALTTPPIFSFLQSSIQCDLAPARDRGKLTDQERTQVMMKMALLKRLDSHGGQPVKSGKCAADTVGCTAVCVLLSQTEVICANAGDSRAILCRVGRPVELSHDHKPNDIEERRRIEAAGGRIEEVSAATRIHYRVNGNLNLSRAIGDMEYKRAHQLEPESQMICSTPDIVVETLTDDDKFIVLACDGVWDVKTNAEVCDFVGDRLGRGERLLDTMEALLDDCISADLKETKGLGGDNMTCVVVHLQACLE